MACSPWCLWSSLPSHLSSTAALQPAQRWRRNGGGGKERGGDEQHNRNDNRKIKKKKEKKGKGDKKEKIHDGNHETRSNDAKQEKRNPRQIVVMSTDSEDVMESSDDWYHSRSGQGSAFSCYMSKVHVGPLVHWVNTFCLAFPCLKCFHCFAMI